MLITVRHVTRYTYAAPARYQVQSLRLTPCNFESQRVLSWSVKAPNIDKAVRFRDGFGNVGHLLSVIEPTDEIVVEASGVVETSDRAGVVRGLLEVAPTRVYLRETPITQADAAIRALAAAAPGTDALSRLHGLMHAVRDAVAYRIGVTGAHTTAAEALAAGEGVCQDHAHIFIAAARVLGIPARYVSGYFLAGGDEPSEAAHAWAESHVEGIGWIAFDPANRFCPTDHYVRVAGGLDAASAAPVRGTRAGGQAESLDVTVEVQQAQQQQAQSQSQSQGAQAHGGPSQEQTQSR